MPAPCQAVPPGQILALLVGVGEEHIAQATKLQLRREEKLLWTENGNLLGLPPRLCRSTCAFLLVWKSPSVINVKLASFPRNQPNLTYPFLGFTPLLLPENLNQARFSPTPLRPSARSLVRATVHRQCREETCKLFPVTHQT